MAVKELVIVGEEEIGKTTLANALLGWDIFPQTNDGWYIPTKENMFLLENDSLVYILYSRFIILSRQHSVHW